MSSDQTEPTLTFVCAALAHLLSFVLAGLENMDEPLQLVGGIGGVHHQPEVLSSTEVHVERDHPKTGLNLQRVEPSVSEMTPKRCS